MKLLTVTVPAYNAEDYLRQSLDSMLGYDEDLDVIIVNDGSTDSTLEIARSYVERYPQLFRLVDKENGGHGSGVNSGIDLAEGSYFYVLDSDDWLDRAALDELLQQIRYSLAAEHEVDLFLVDCMYEYSYDGTSKLMKFNDVVPGRRVIGWDEVRSMGVDQYFSMHSTVYRTEILHEAGVRLPEHCFYVDNVLAYCPLPWVERLYYLPVPLYRYFIGREDQSVNTDVMIRRADQQLRVTRLMAASYDLERSDLNRSLRRYMIHYFSMMMTISSVILILSKEKENLDKKNELWLWLKKEHPYLYAKCKKKPLNLILCGTRDSKFSNALVAGVYEVARRIYKFA